MKKKSNFGASILVSGLISIIFIAGAGYFALPLIYPNINEELETETETIDSDSHILSVEEESLDSDTEIKVLDNVETVDSDTFIKVVKI